MLLAGLLSSGFSGNFNIVLGDETSSSTNNNLNSWPMFHGDLAHSGYTPSVGPLINQTRWIYATR